MHLVQPPTETQQYPLLALLKDTIQDPVLLVDTPLAQVQIAVTYTLLLVLAAGDAVTVSLIPAPEKPASDGVA